MGVVAVKEEIYDAIVDGSPKGTIELFHGYTYSGHPVACAAALASLDILENEQLVKRVKDISPVFEAALHSLKGTEHIIDIRNYGLAGALQIASYPGAPARRPYEIAMKCWEKGFYVRYGGDTIQLGLPFIVESQQIDDVINAIGESIRELDK